MLNADELADLFASTEANITFTQRPDPIPGDLRIGWRLSALAIVLDKCRGGTANPEQIHLLIWALRSSSSREMIQRWISGERMPDDFAVRYDPALSRTISIAVASGLAERRPNQSIALTSQGSALARTVWSDREVLREEKGLLSSLPGKITQKAIRDLMSWS
ncbi:hypothetical protein [Streptomyces sp. NBC_01190]|uniref:hypothetical protein n=1 Tax=Streptomyces sp. NBC_01190 TaxID=2903767 RepID=UPI00387027FC|nr:hypothetical protein OG519_28850 [Streptomyces sp. NBC_01190]